MAKLGPVRGQSGASRERRDKSGRQARVSLFA